MYAKSVRARYGCVKVIQARHGILILKAAASAMQACLANAIEKQILRLDLR